MRVLVISHNVFDYTTSMGKTLSKLFEGCSSIELAQLYIHKEEPCRDDICNRYYRITDKEAITSIFLRNNVGKEYTHAKVNDISINDENSIQNKLYQKGRSRTPVIYLLRDLIWSLSNWHNKKLINWIRQFAPDVVFLASGDYGFIYRIAYIISKELNKPLVTMCFDDYYIYNKNEDKILGKYRQRVFLRIVKRTIDYSKFIITICDSMSEEYSKLFNKKCYTLHTPAEFDSISFNPSAKHIAYFGSLGLGRDKQLISIGKALRNLDIDGKPDGIDVYSTEQRKEVLRNMTYENGIIFHNAVSQSKMKELLKDCIAVIHTESFDPSIIGRTKFSVSTKIPEALAYGPCLFAYGPDNVASLKYLKNNEAAVVTTSEEDLAMGLKRVLCDNSYRTEVIARARKVAIKNHDVVHNSEMLYQWLSTAILEN